MTADRPRTLVLMRHAKAESTPSGPIGGDIGRRLTPTGHADAEAAGRWLAGVGCVPDHAVVSAAERTQQTWAAVAAGSGSSARAEVSRSMYGASADSILESLRLVPDAAEVVIFVGHNPDTEVLAGSLGDGAGPDEAEAGLAGGFPTATLAVYDVPTAWEDLTPGGVTVRHVHTARA
ncbi:histidine phosphatase family protein [Nocardioides sp. HDW12B]|uniref:SixA phosphatase family protein n=1 Tax=Nocardioides sp. HDW12B TaxID=2714939 RepID=UPI00140E3B8E|nr:histidine phosphatase family protein [Nocardioides sp. HDW12B]QIK66366.1 histidine phosphatase family protein [Nocardioides sp. HDW12B]